MAPSVLQLECSCNNYPWGKVGKESLAATLCAQTPGIDFKIEDGQHYAECWMGDYPVLPAKVLETGQELRAVIDSDKEHLLGKRVTERFDAQLPFLPKILSIAKALPLQIHPNKDLAAQLHEKEPEKFTDTNHKPEIGCCLRGKFELFAGWKPNAEIQALFDELEPIQVFVPKKGEKITDPIMRKICTNIFHASDADIKKIQQKLGDTPKEKYGSQSYILDLLPRLQDQYSVEDPGNLVALLLMNFMTLTAGQAVYIPADAPHAYLSGDIVECMARSNNVLNTGFCPRPDRDDIELFTSTMTFAPHSAKEVLLPAKPSDRGVLGKTEEYKPGMSEFNMLKTTLGKSEKETVKPIDGPSVLFVTSGQGKMQAEGKEHDLAAGYVYFVGAGVETTFAAQDGLEIWRAYAE